MLAATNPDLDEEQMRDRLDRVSDYISPDAAPERAAAWIADDPSEYARALGDRLVIVHSEAEPLFEGALAATRSGAVSAGSDRGVPGGPISRPDILAARLRTFGPG